MSGDLGHSRVCADEMTVAEAGSFHVAGLKSVIPHDDDHAQL